MMPIARLFALVACLVALNANAALVRGAVGATGPANYSPSATPAKLADQSGLSVAYTSGVTDFDSYAASATHNSTFASNGWSQSGGGAVTFDLGGNYDITGLALWNRGWSDQGLKDFALYSCADTACATQQLIGNYVALSGLGSDLAVQAQTISFSSVNTSVLKLEIGSTYNASGITTLGEVAFREGARSTHLPEPASVGLVMLALGGLAAVRRRTGA